jgi:hypothetical protein
MARVLRYDRGELAKPVRTPQGLRVEGYAARPGIYPYLRNGKMVRELRPRSEVFSPAALAGYEAAPITNGHVYKAPGVPERLSKDPTLRAKHSRGVVLTARADGDKVAVAGTITDPATIADMEAGRRELSPVYEAEVDETPGVDPEFGAYDAIQRDIRVDSLAIVDRARGGREMQIRTDGIDEGFGIRADAGCAYADEDGNGGVDGCDGTCSMMPDDVRADEALTSEARNALHPQKFAVPGKRKLPIMDKGHVIAAMGGHGLSATEGLTPEEKSEAATRIANAAKKFDVDASNFADKHGVRSDEMNPPKPTPTVTPAPAPAAGAETIESVKAALAVQQTRADGLEARLSARDLELTQVKAKLKELDGSDAHLRAARTRADEADLALKTYQTGYEDRIRKAAEIRTKAVILLGPKVRFDGLDDDAVCRMILKSVAPNEDHSNKSSEYMRVRVDEFVLAHDEVAHERAQIARAVRADSADVRADGKPKIKHADLWKQGPPATRAIRNKEQR